MATMNEYFSVLALFILFRETIEASIICGVLLQFLNRSKPALKRTVWWGVAAGVGVSIIFGIIFIAIYYTAQNNLFRGTNRDWFKGVISWIAALLITILAFAMLRFLGWERKWKRKLTAAMAKKTEGVLALEAARAAAAEEAKTAAHAAAEVAREAAEARAAESGEQVSESVKSRTDETHSSDAEIIKDPPAADGSALPSPPAPPAALQAQPSLGPSPSMDVRKELLPHGSQRRAGGVRGWWEGVKRRVMGAEATGEARVAVAVAAPAATAAADSADMIRSSSSSSPTAAGGSDSKDVGEVDPAKDVEGVHASDVAVQPETGDITEDMNGRDMTPATRKEKWNIWILVFTTVVREGIESVVFLGGLGNVKLSAVPLPAFVGIVCGVLVGMFLYYTGKTVKHIAWLVVSMSIVMFFIAAGQVNLGVDALYKAGMFGYCSPWYDERPWFMIPMYDWSACCNDLDPVGTEPTDEQNRRRFFALARAVFGYQDKGTPIEIIFYCCYWGLILIIVLFKWWRGTLFDADYKHTKEQKRIAKAAARKAELEAQAARAVEEGEDKDAPIVGTSGVYVDEDGNEQGGTRWQRCWRATKRAVVYVRDY